MRLPHNLGSKLAIAVATPLLLLCSAEFALYRLDFDGSGPLQLSFGKSDPMRNATIEDRELFWRLAPNQHFDLNGLSFTTNELGLRGDLPARDKPKDVYRIICVGDSTAFGNFTSYPDELRSVLPSRIDGKRVEIMNAGVPGFSAVQGLAFLERELIAYSPDLVTFCFGYNNAKDALGNGPTDEQIANARSTLLGKLHFEACRFRLGRFVERWIVGKRRSFLGFSASAVPERVSADAYADIVFRAAELCERRGSKFVAITQPNGFREGSLAKVDRSRDGYILEQARRLDQQARAIVDRCARDSIACVDLRAALANDNPVELYSNPLPGPDSIHLNPIGLHRFAIELRNGLMATKALPDSVLLPTNAAQPSTISLPAIAPLRRAGSTSDDLIVACVAEGKVLLGVLDPGRGDWSTIESTLDPPDRPLQVSALPIFQDEILVCGRTTKGEFVVASAKLDGTAGTLPRQQLDLPATFEWFRVTPVDLRGDGRPEYLVDFGPLTAPYCLLLDDRASLLARLALPLDPGRPIGVARSKSSGVEHLLVTGAASNRPTAFRLLGNGKFALDRELEFGIPATSSLLAFLEVDGSAPTLFVCRPPAFVIDGSDSPRFLFPLGAPHVEARRPGPSLAIVPSKDGSAPTLMVASLRGDRIELLRVDRNGATRLPDLSL